MLDEKNLNVLKQLMSNDLSNSTQVSSKENPEGLSQRRMLPKERDIIKFGAWSLVASDEKKPVEWLTLRVFEKESTAILITRECIDAQPCDLDGVTSMLWKDGEKAPYTFRWLNSSLFHWLRDEFYTQCFNEDEKRMIIDQVVIDGQDRFRTPVNLLSATQVLSLLPRPYERQAKGTPFCSSKTKKNDYISWWLLDTTEFETDAAVVYPDGSVCARSSDESIWTDRNHDKNIKPKRVPNCHGINATSIAGVRPVIRVQFDKVEVPHDN